MASPLPPPDPDPDRPAAASLVAAGRFLRLLRRDGWEYASRANASGVVAVVAVTADGRLLLTAQQRIPVGRRVIDLPAGLAGDDPGAAGEALAAAAGRELAEEVGWSAERLEPLATCPTSPGLSDEIVILFRAQGLRRSGAGGGVAGEGIAVLDPPLAGIRAWLAERERAGDLVDLKVWAALALL